MENLPVSPLTINNLQRQSLLKSSLFSAKIEGNTLEENDLNHLNNLDSNLKERIEVENIVTAFNYVRKNSDKRINKSFLLDLHKIVMKGLTADSGKLRIEPSAIFNQSGFPVYMPPPPSEIDNLLTGFFDYINSKKEKIFL